MKNLEKGKITYYVPEIIDIGEKARKPYKTAVFYKSRLLIDLFMAGFSFLGLVIFPVITIIDTGKIYDFHVMIIGAGLLVTWMFLSFYRRNKKYRI